MLEKYNQKRKFNETPEPEGKRKSGKGALRFVIQKHQASHLHYDFRLENRGVLLSWAVPKGPSLNPNDKRLAMQVEDHPFDYRTFEGTIPEGNYGAGTVMVWDEGTYGAVIGPNGEEADRKESEKLIAQNWHKGHLTFNLHGKKLNGEFALVRIKSDKSGKAWLLVKADKDKYSSKKDVTKQDKSAVTDRTLEEIAKDDKSIVWESNKKKEKAKKRVAPAKEKKNEPIRGARYGKKRAIPKEHISPMLATLTAQPFDDKNWLFEIKLDGFRAIAEVHKNKKVELYSRNNISFNTLFMPLVYSLKELGHDAILDGEVVVLNKKGISEFQLLQNYQNTGEGQLTYFVFDILYLDGYDLREMPLLERKSILKELVDQLAAKDVLYSDHILGKGKKFYQLARKQGLEGVIAKEARSEYIGKRSRSWLKVKTHMRQEAVIGGFTEPRGSRKNLGALVLGVYNDKGELEYIGHTGGGLNQKNLQAVHSKLTKLERKTSPFRDKFKVNAPVTWVDPKLVCEISFQEWTGDGHMRQPIFEGLRIDKKAKEVRREKPE